MKKVALIAVITILFALLGFAQTASAAVTLGDGGFEGGNPNVYWSWSSSSLGTSPIINAGFARTGSYYALLGRGCGGCGEVTKISQPVKMPKNGKVTLRFYLWTSSYDAAGSDKLTVKFGGKTVLKVMETDSNYNWGGYTLVEIDLSAFTDGGTHTLVITGTDKSGGLTAFRVDDFAIAFFATENGGMELDSNNDKVPDGWKISSPSGQTRRVCDTAYEGSCSVRLQGTTGSRERLIYVYKAGSTGRATDSFALMLRGRANFTVTGQWGLTVEAFNTDGTVTTLVDQPLISNTGGQFTNFGFSVAPPKDYKKIKITIWHLGQAPEIVYVDNVVMSKTGGPVP